MNKRKILQSILKFLSKLLLKKYKPDIIAVTGSVGKTSAKEACFWVLSQKFKVRRSLKNYNTEIGVPLTLISTIQPERSIIKWALVFIKTVLLLLIKFPRYPKIFILEVAADKPGDIEYLTSLIKPKIGIITSISRVHLSKFKKFSKIISEKRKVIECLPREGFAVLNFDDEILRRSSTKTAARIITYGVENKDSDIKARDVKITEKDNSIGLYFKLFYKDTVIPVFVKDVLAYHYVYSFLAASALGHIYNLTPFDVAKGIEKFRVIPQRFKAHDVKNDLMIIDDTYNSSPKSACSALKSLSAIPGRKRKIAVLGDMLELGSYSKKGHIKVGKRVFENGINFLITLGKSSKDICEGARKSGMDKNNIYCFNLKEDVIKFLNDFLEPGDAVLIKGSRGMKMEDIVRGVINSN